MPGAGGTQRLPRLIGAEAALKLMLRGRHIPPHEALKLGAIDAVVPEIRSRRAARKVAATRQPVSVQPWDGKDFRVPGGAPFSPKGMLTWAAANALYRKETYDNYDAQRAIMSCVYEGLSVKSIDAGPARSRPAISPSSCSETRRRR